MEIFVDADACPVKAEVLRVAQRYGVQVHMVANSGMAAHRHPLVTMVVVPPQPDAADDWIAEHVTAGDIVITADIPLAARCLEAGAAALGPQGKPFNENNIGSAVAMRDLKAHLRETGESKGYNPDFTKRDRSNFLQALDALVQRQMRQAASIRS